MKYQWDASLETGHLRIDNQHKQLFNTVNNITDLTEQGKGKEEINKTVEFLVSYTVMHFDGEEKLMEIYHYPDYPNHKDIHTNFKNKVGELSKRLAVEGPTDEVMKTLASTVGDWLIIHIKGEDIRMAAYIKSKGDSGQ